MLKRLVASSQVQKYSRVLVPPNQKVDVHKWQFIHVCATKKFPKNFAPLQQLHCEPSYDC